MDSETNTELLDTDYVDPMDNDMVNRAAYEFKIGVLGVGKLGKDISGNGVRRVLTAVAEYPLSESTVKFSNPVEQELFTLTLKVLAAKHTMMDAVMRNQMARANALQEAEASFKEAQLGQVASQEG